MRREYAIIAPHITAKGGIYEPRESPHLHHPCHRLCRTALLLLVLSGLRLYRLSLAPPAAPPANPIKNGLPLPLIKFTP